MAQHIHTHTHAYKPTKTNKQANTPTRFELYMRVHLFSL